MTKKNNGTVKKKITLKNFKDYILELLSESDDKGITIVSTDLLSEVENKHDNEADISLAYTAIKDTLKKYKGSVIDEEESTGDIEALIFNQLKKENIPVAFKIYPGCYHAFDMIVPWSKQARDAKRFVMDNFKEFLKI